MNSNSGRLSSEKTAHPEVDKSFVLFFSHSPQMNWFSFFSRVLRVRFGLSSILWVVGENERLGGKKLGEFDEVVNIAGDESVFSQFNDVDDAKTYLRSFEDEVGEPYVNRDVAMDRYIAATKWSNEKSLIYAAGILFRIRSEIAASGQPIFAIGEENCLHYRLARRAVASPYFCPFMVGHFGNRFYFEYTMYYQWSACQNEYKNFLERGVPEEFRKIAEERLNDLITTQRRPRVTERFIKEGGNSILNRLTIKRLVESSKKTWKNLISDKEPWNPKYQSILRANLLFSTIALFRESYRKRRFKRLSIKQVPTNQDYAGFFLHMQPEHTVEGVAFEYRDQATTALNIAASLPAGMELLVKEHFPMVGKRPVNFYRKLDECPNIRLLDDSINSYEVIKDSKLMFTLSGSVALESMYLGKPSIVLGQIFHTAFEGIYPAGDIRDLASLVNRVLNCKQPGATREEAIAALAAMYSTSYPGLISSQFSLEEMGAEENLESIALALAQELALQEIVK